MLKTSRIINFERVKGIEASSQAFVPDERKAIGFPGSLYRPKENWLRADGLPWQIPNAAIG
jgi:hypothetical protein